MSKTNIVQTYLKPREDGVERRVRQRGTVEDGFTFYYTEKRDTGYGERDEVEDKITPAEYINYMSEADTSLHSISKERCCFLHKNQYYEMDIYPFSDKYAILELELNDINESFELPPVNVIKEVTDDKSYRNGSLAKTLCFADEKPSVLQQSNVSIPATKSTRESRVKQAEALFDFGAVSGYDNQYE